ncbi:vesicle-trafficking protein SEC22b-like [Sycon ciliatum]|uniref:vesicle-trafficking protein SEC22b-like n=1 Tax=Sycon ciliatum TaxID=27933 RepID=UPI0031F69509
MVLLTLIARASDGLLLSGSVQEAEETGRSDMTEYQNKAKQLFRKLGSNAASPSTVDDGEILFHYIVADNVCYMALCEKTFSKRMAFSYLEELREEFSNMHSTQVASAQRPYAFIEFATALQRLKKPYVDSRAHRSGVKKLNDELVDVQRIMVQNIDDVLQRGEHMTSLASKAQELSSQSQIFRKDAAYLNLRSKYAMWAAMALILVVMLLFLRYMVF